MTTSENSSTTNWDSTNTNQTSTETIDLTNYVTKDEYTNAQSFGTKARQGEIAMAIKLVEKDSSELHKIEDIKLKDAITKQSLNMTYAEAIAVMGNNFSITTSPNGDDSSNWGNNGNLSDIEKQLRLLQYKEQNREVESALADFAAKNPSFFSGDAEWMREKILNELGNISSSLSIDERVRRAATVSIWNPLDKESLAYNLLLSAQSGSSQWGTAQVDQEKIKIHNIQNEMRLAMGLKQK